MTGFNIVRMRVKPGYEQQYLSVHRERSLEEMPGMLSLNVVQTGERDFCVSASGRIWMRSLRPGQR